MGAQSSERKDVGCIAYLLFSSPLLLQSWYLCSKRYLTESAVFKCFVRMGDMRKYLYLSSSDRLLAKYWEMLYCSATSQSTGLEQGNTENEIKASQLWPLQSLPQRAYQTCRHLDRISMIREGDLVWSQILDDFPEFGTSFPLGVPWKACSVSESLPVSHSVAKIFANFWSWRTSGWPASADVAQILLTVLIVLTTSRDSPVYTAGKETLLKICQNFLPLEKTCQAHNKPAVLAVEISTYSTLFTIMAKWSFVVFVAL